MLRTGGTKMILTVDIGNTTMTMGLYTPEGVLQFRGSIKTDKNKTRDQIAIDLLDMFQLVSGGHSGCDGGGGLQRGPSHDRGHGRRHPPTQRGAAHDRGAGG